MKKSRIAVLVLALVLIAGTMSVFADYENKMTVSPGNGSFEQGKTVPDDAQSASITTGDNAVLTITDSEGGTTEIKVTPPTDKHFVTGLKVAGRDNTTTVGTQTLGGEDKDFVVSYGLKTNMVKYKVYYRNAATGEAIAGLPASEEFVGVKGNKPVISWRYAEGYLPQAYNLTGTLSDGENEFTFWYYAVDAEGNIITVVEGVPAGTAAAAAGGAAADGTADGTTINDGDTPMADGPEDLIDIDDSETPQTDGDGTNPEDIDDNKTPGSAWKTVGIGAGVIAVIAIAAAVLAKRKKDE